MRQFKTNFILRFVAVCAAVACAAPFCIAQEVELSAEDKNLMDPFEAHSLGRSDACFNNKQYRPAAAGYDSFILEFPQCRVLAYAVFRKARSIDLDNKRFEAIKAYNEVLDYFPNDVHYAAAALYYIGMCYHDAGDPENAVKAWVRMVQDKDYRKHYLAASALNMLAQNYVRQKDFEKAMTYYEQVVEDFRSRNFDAAWAAMWKVIEYRMRDNPDEPKLRAFYVAAAGFERGRAKNIPSDVSNDMTYWNFIRQYVKHYGGQFQPLQAEQKEAFYRYWAGAMQGKFAAVDDFQIDLVDFQLFYENDPARRVERLDAQFEKYQKPGDNERIIKWLTLYRGNKNKMNEYYSKLQIEKLDYATMEKLVFALVEQQEYGMALNAFEKLSFRELSDSARTSLMRRLWQPVRSGLSVSSIERVAGSYADQDLGGIELLRFYHWMHNTGKGIPLAEKLASSSPNFSSEAYYKLGDLQFWAGEFEKAIRSYQLADSPPATLFQIVQCYSRLGKLEMAIGTLTEVENFFPRDAPRAALTKAHLLKNAGLRDRQVAALRNLMKKYPGSGESRTAHEELEALDVLIGGGVDSE